MVGGYVFFKPDKFILTMDSPVSEEYPTLPWEEKMKIHSEHRSCDVRDSRIVNIRIGKRALVHGKMQYNIPYPLPHNVVVDPSLDIDVSTEFERTSLVAGVLTGSADICETFEEAEAYLKRLRAGSV